MIQLACRNNDCIHKNCANVRAQAAEKCVLCRQEIGFDEPFLRSDRGAVHAICGDSENQRCAA